MELNRRRITKLFQEYDNSIKSKGVCLVNTESESAELAYGFDNNSEPILNSITHDKGYKKMVRHFKSLFKNQAIPYHVTIKTESKHQFIRFLDEQYIICSWVESDHTNFSKVNNKLDSLCTNLTKL